MNKSADNDNESVRLAIQAGIVASCLTVILGNFESLANGFQMFIKLLAVLLGLASMSYIMLTARKYGFKEKKDIKFRGYIYDKTITFYWYIFATLVYLFLSSFMTYLLGISIASIYITSMIIVTLVLVVAFIFWFYKKIKHNKNK